MKKQNIKSFQRRKETLRNPRAVHDFNLAGGYQQFLIFGETDDDGRAKLYEEGYITYMRTDSVNLSLESLVAAKKLHNLFGKLCARKSALLQDEIQSAQEAHEAISRQTLKPDDLMPILEPNQYKLYKLIWNRTVACQMQAHGSIP